jgi:hypothetical protein
LHVVPPECVSQQSVFIGKVHFRVDGKNNQVRTIWVTLKSAINNVHSVECVRMSPRSLSMNLVQEQQSAGAGLDGLGFKCSLKFLIGPKQKEGTYPVPLVLGLGAVGPTH